jgi:hypothetical protein
MFDLPFKEIWALDFEFRTAEGLGRRYPITPGALPVPLCMVARERTSGRLLRLWHDQLGPTPPFCIDDETLFIAFFSSAEWGCFLALGWPLPTRVIDLYAEFRRETNGMVKSELYKGKHDLLHALSYHGIYTITAAQKEEERQLILRGGPWTPADRTRILDYCQTDVDPLDALLERMLPSIRLHPKGLPRAVLRGRYTLAVARMEHTGVPIDVPLLHRLRTHWADIKLKLVAEVDAAYGVYEGTRFKAGLFEAWLADNDMAWPRTILGHLKLDRDTFEKMVPRYEQVHPVRPLMELRHALGEMRLENLAVGSDGRNRVLLSPFGATTARNTPSNTGFIFGPAVWLRGLIKPAEGRALAYIDWRSQEVAIAAALSGDPALLKAIRSGDVYLAFAKMAGLVPAEATKQSHKRIRDMCKTCVLGINYGMGPETLALRTGLSKREADRLIRRFAQDFPVRTEWLESVIAQAQLRGYLSTRLGWTLKTAPHHRPTAQRNFPMQATGNEMLRLACSLATERGVQVCAPVHDAVLIEADAERIDDAVAVMRAAMAEASRIVLDGLVIATDVEIIAWPNRYDDQRGRAMWTRVMGILNTLG